MTSNKTLLLCSCRLVVPHWFATFVRLRRIFGKIETRKWWRKNRTITSANSKEKCWITLPVIAHRSSPRVLLDGILLVIITLYQSCVLMLVHFTHRSSDCCFYYIAFLCSLTVHKTVGREKKSFSLSPGRSTGKTRRKKRLCSSD